ncbi:MAG: hypothetical protein ACJ8BW_39095, partial [Ktedonobacteraceae bacterium]
MDEHTIGGEQEDLLDLNEVMQAFGVTAWTNLGRVEMAPAQNLGIRVEIQGQPYILRERPEGMVTENADHRYAFRQFLQQAGIPIPLLWQTPRGESALRVGEDFFELEQ